jgi:FlaA1/EpsC-like NDP-sugar epimerase
MKRKQLLFIAGDVAAVSLANILAIFLRFDFNWSVVATAKHPSLELLLIDLVLTPTVFLASGLYQGYWKYAGLNDLVRLLRAVVFRTIALVMIFYMFDLNGLSRAIVIMNTVLLLLLTGAIRLGPRFRFEILASRKRNLGSNTLIIGAGDTGESLLRELRKTGQTEFNPVGFVDDDRDKLGVKIHGVPVIGSRATLEELIEEYRVREVICAIPAASKDVMREILDICRRGGARFKTVPTAGELERGAARIGQIRAVSLEDLLGREVINMDQVVLRRSLRGRRVLVTGAAGSIGRELARQIAAYEPQTLLLLDRNENNLFYLEAEMREAYPLQDLHIVVGDMLDRCLVEGVFRGIRPEVVFHAAAYKHVPLMEQHPIEAIKNNVLATRQLAELSAAHNVERFIYISTDKAVQPTSIMGATKQLGERLTRSIEPGSSRFMAVRFGNVLGSDGSVIPTFKKQIVAGGPVTVTHPEVTRFFMTIPEAVQLVLMAGAMGEGSELFLLQMGQPVRIVDLATNMIELSGLKPGEDIKIVFTGLRPGEKLHEDLRNEGEKALPTTNEKIMVLTGVEPLTADDWRAVDALELSTRAGSLEESLVTLRKLVPDYRPTPGFAMAGATTPRNIVDITSKRSIDAQG